MENKNPNQFKIQKLQKAYQQADDFIGKIKLRINEAAENKDHLSIITNINNLKTIERRFHLSGQTDGYKQIRDFREEVDSVYQDQEFQGLLRFLDKDIISPPELKAFHLASSFGLLDKKTAQKYYQDGSDGSLTDYQKKQIQELQTQLQKDNLYNGQIDGIWGPQSQKALDQLIEENLDLKDIKAKILRNGILEVTGQGNIKNIPFLDISSSPKNEMKF